MAKNRLLLPLPQVFARAQASTGVGPLGLLALPAVLAATVLVPGCGVFGSERNWISDGAAVVRCTVAGKEYELAPLALELPAPPSPTGLYARVLDPMGLDDLGYERDRTVCASLEPPTDVELLEAETSVPALLEVRAQVAKDVQEFGECRCEVARRLDKHELIPACVGAAWKPECDVSDGEEVRMKKALEPLDDALAAAQVPLVHWRLAGVADRPQRFAKKPGTLVPRHSGGSEVYLRGAPVPRRRNHVLIEKLLEQHGVSAVVRQDSGTAILVVRVLGKQLVLDHFAYPNVEGQALSLLPHLDNAQVDRYVAMLEAPQAERKLALDRDRGTLVELDRAGLERVDAGLAIAARLGAGYNVDREEYELGPIVFDRVTFQVPFGTEGKVAEAKLRVSDEGQQWLAGLSKAPVVPGLPEVVASPVVPAFRPGGDDPGFLLRGRPPDTVWFAGVHAFVEILREIENVQPGSMEGTGRDWTLTIPSGPLPGEFETREGLKRLRERLSKTRHTLHGRLSADHGTLELTLSPK